MKYERLDKKCTAKVLAKSENQLLIKASWPARQEDHSRFHVIGGTAFNTLHVSKGYFKERYGVEL